jgi:hypothetical protein
MRKTTGSRQTRKSGQALRVTGPLSGAILNAATPGRPLHAVVIGCELVKLYKGIGEIPQNAVPGQQG